MMKARRSASNCGASAQARREGRGGRRQPVSGQGFPQARDGGPAGGRVGRHSPPGWDTWHRLWSPPAGCRTCRRTPGRPVQSMGLPQPRQGDSRGSARPPPHSSLLPSPTPFMVNPNIIPVASSPRVRAPETSTDFRLLISRVAVACCLSPPSSYRTISGPLSASWCGAPHTLIPWSARLREGLRLPPAVLPALPPNLPSSPLSSENHVSMGQ